MNGRTRDAALLTLAMASLVAIAVAKERTQHASPRSTFSTYDRGPNGYAALYDVLHAAGVPVRRLQRSLSRFDGRGTLVVSDATGDPSSIAFVKADASALQRFLARGGRLVVLSADFDKMRQVVPQFARAGTIVPISQPARSGSGIAVASYALREETGVSAVDAPAGSTFARTKHASAVLRGGDGTFVAIEYAAGPGSVIASTSPQSFGNAWLLRRDNVRFAYAVLAGRGPVTFDEYVHGYDDDANFWQAVPVSVKWALLLAAALVLAGLTGANVPFAPPIRLDSPDERTSAAYVHAMGSLMRRARARTDAIAALARNVRRGPPSSQRLQAVAELDRLAAGRPGNAALQRAARLEFKLRKERS